MTIVVIMIVSCKGSVRNEVVGYVIVGIIDYE